MLKEIRKCINFVYSNILLMKKSYKLNKIKKVKTIRDYIGLKYEWFKCNCDLNKDRKINQIKRLKEEINATQII